MFKKISFVKRPLFVVLAICLLFSLPSGQVEDITPPELVDFDFSPAAIDVSTGAQSINVIVKATDDLSGIVSSRVEFKSPSGEQRKWAYLALVDGDALSGTWEGTITVPQYSEAGTWKVHYVRLGDAVRNRIRYYASDLQALGFSTDLNVLSEPSDTEAPTVESISISPSSIDVSAGPQTVTIELHLKDDVSGVQFVHPGFGGEVVIFDSPSGGQWASIPTRHITRISGNPNDGIWQGTVTIPQYSETGIWKIAEVSVLDAVFLFRTLSTTDLQALGFPTDLHVSSNPSDILPPELTDLMYHPMMINTQTGSQQVTIELDLTDNLSGVDFSLWPGYSNIGGLRFVSPTANQIQQANWPDFNLISGSPFNGTWQAIINFPQFCEGGKWQISWIYFCDATRNCVRLITADLQATGFPTELIVVGQNYPPVAVCKDIEIVANANCQAYIIAEDVDGGSYDPNKDEITLSLDNLGPFSIGEHYVNLTVTDEYGESDTCEAKLTVVDTTAPTIDTLSATPSVLKPPNHKMVLITPTITVSDNCDPNPVVVLTSITMNEGEETNTYDPNYDSTVGDGHTLNDIHIDENGDIYLRAERSGTGTGRIYTIIYTVTDASSNSASASATVTVPHDQK
jgi:hypothetical protein